MVKWHSDDVLFVPLGGAEEIGMNANLFHYRDQWLMVDLGVSFPDDKTPGVNVLLPDIGFIEERRDNLCGLVVTHGHEDHLGAIPYLWERLGCPIYCTAFTGALLRAKLQEHLPDVWVDLRLINYNEEVRIGEFSVEAIAMTHSVPDSSALAIRVGGKTIVHTGDWKFDQSPLIGETCDLPALKRLGDAGVDVILGDSTNAMVQGRTGSEEDAREGLLQAIREETGRVAVTCFASNVARVDSLVKIAGELGRHPLLVGRSLHRIKAVAESCGYLDDWGDLLSESDYDLIPRENVLLICTGSQGEAGAALARIASDSHPRIGLDKGDAVLFSSRQIPGNEQAIARVQDNLVRRGIKVITDDDAPIHVSGHPAREELMELYQLLKPEIVIPVHGTPRHLMAHAELALACQVPQSHVPRNGEIISLARQKAEVLGSVKTGLQITEAGDLIALDSDLIKSRQRMLWHGSVSASLVLNFDGDLCLAPSVAQIGVFDGERGVDYLSEAALRLEDGIMSLSASEFRDDEHVETLSQRILRRLAKELGDRRPVVSVHINRVAAMGVS